MNPLAAEHALNKNHALGKVFWAKRGFFVSPSLNRGYLKKLKKFTDSPTYQTALDANQQVAVVPLPSFSPEWEAREQPTVQASAPSLNNNNTFFAGSRALPCVTLEADTNRAVSDYPLLARPASKNIAPAATPVPLYPEVPLTTYYVSRKKLVPSRQNHNGAVSDHSFFAKPTRVLELPAAPSHDVLNNDAAEPTNNSPKEKRQLYPG